MKSEALLLMKQDNDKRGKCQIREDFYSAFLIFLGKIIGKNFHEQPGGESFSLWHFCCIG